MEAPHYDTVDFTGLRLESTYADLPSSFYSQANPVPVSQPQLLLLNTAFAAQLGLDLATLDTKLAAEFFAGNRLPISVMPIAQAYAGHQFGHFTLLGDGRAHLLGEYIDPRGKRFDLQLKGSGRTPYSRRGDGRAALGPMLREYIISEAMHALGIPTTRSLAVVATGEKVWRERALPGAILTRVASSHIRVGTFEYVAATGSVEDLRALADYTIRRHYPELAAEDETYLSLLNAVIGRQASLVARWMCVGFIHGVMNTDNMAISGETIDYGPCAFMDDYHPHTVFSSIDEQGRYAYGNQPGIAQWNLARFAETLLPLLHADPDRSIALAEEAITAFAREYHEAWVSGMRAKLGLINAEEDDAEMIDSLLTAMQSADADFTNTFRQLSLTNGEVCAEVQAWLPRWHARLARQPGGREEALRRMQSSNPAVIPRNHLVERALDLATETGDITRVRKLLDVLSKPYQPPRDAPEYCMPPKPEERVLQTFCGT